MYKLIRTGEIEHVRVGRGPLGTVGTDEVHRSQLTPPATTRSVKLLQVYAARVPPRRQSRAQRLMPLLEEVGDLYVARFMTPAWNSFGDLKEPSKALGLFFVYR